MKVENLAKNKLKSYNLKINQKIQKERNWNVVKNNVKIPVGKKTENNFKLN